MTIADLKERIEAHSPGCKISREWLLEQISEMPEANFGSMTWATIKEASAITGLSETWLRRKAPGWASFDEPDIRVWKMNPKKHSSPWLFSVEDCEAFRERHEQRRRPEIVPDSTGDPDDLDRLTEHYVDKVTVNL